MTENQKMIDMILKMHARDKLISDIKLCISKIESTQVGNEDDIFLSDEEKAERSNKICSAGYVNLSQIADDIADPLFRISAAASLICFERPDEKYRFDLCDQGSLGHRVFLENLTNLKMAILSNESKIKSLLQGSRVKFSSKTAFAVAVLSLSAFNPRKNPDVFCTYSGVSKTSNDVVGDAQFIAEHRMKTGETLTFRI